MKTFEKNAHQDIVNLEYIAMVMNVTHFESILSVLKVWDFINYGGYSNPLFIKVQVSIGCR